MSQLATDRTTSNSASDHVNDHNELHRLHNVWDGTAPSDFLSIAAADAGFRLNKRVQVLTDAASVTIDLDNYEGGYLASVSQTTTFLNPPSAPVEFQQFILRIKSATVQTLIFQSIFRAGVTITLPTQTSGSNLTDYLGFQYNAQDGTLDLLAKTTGY